MPVEQVLFHVIDSGEHNMAYRTGGAALVHDIVPVRGGFGAKCLAAQVTGIGSVLQGDKPGHIR